MFVWAALHGRVTGCCSDLLQAQWQACGCGVCKFAIATVNSISILWEFTPFYCSINPPRPESSSILTTIFTLLYFSLLKKEKLDRYMNNYIFISRLYIIFLIKIGRINTYKSQLKMPGGKFIKYIRHTYIYCLTWWITGISLSYNTGTGHWTDINGPNAPLWYKSHGPFLCQRMENDTYAPVLQATGSSELIFIGS